MFKIVIDHKISRRQVTDRDFKTVGCYVTYEDNKDTSSSYKQVIKINRLLR